MSKFPIIQHLFVLGFISITLASPDSRNAAFNEFLVRTIEDFKRDVLTEPSSFPDESQAFFSTSPLGLVVTGIILDRHINGLTSLDAQYTSSDLVEGSFRIEMSLGDVNCTGRYNLTGSVQSYPLNGTGSWDSASTGINSFSLSVYYQTVNGYVVIHSNFSSSWFRQYASSNDSFSELIDENYLGTDLAQRVRESLADYAGHMLRGQSEFYLGVSMVEYFQAIFERTPLIDIIVPKPSEVKGSSARNEDDDKFSQFVNETLWRFAELIPDPLRPSSNDSVELGIRNNLFELNGTLSDTSLARSSLFLGLTDHSSISNDYRKLYFFLLFNTTIFSGQYNLNGSIASAIPIRGSGEWSLVGQLRSEFSCEVRINVTNEGYVVITGRPDSFWTFRFNPGTPAPIANFPGLLDENLLGSELTEEISREIQNRMVDVLDELYTKVYQDTILGYLQSIFDETPLADIIGKV